MAGGGEPAHVATDLGQEDGGAELADARDRHQEVDGGAKGAQLGG
jgi:hypothetical protein